MKKALSILLILCMTISLLFANSVMADPAVTFSDVTAGTELGNAIYKLVESGVVVGYPDGTFKSDNNLTRAELTKMVNLVFGYTEADTEGFIDVTDADWFKPYVLVAKKAGYIKGFEDGSFRGNSNLTREQACAIISRCANLKETKMIINISDPVSDWADVDVKKVIAAGFMNLEEGDKFRAKEDISRGELSILLTRYMDAKAKEQAPPVVVPSVGGDVSTGGGGSAGGGGGGGTDVPYCTVSLVLNGGSLPTGASTTLSMVYGTSLSSSSIPTPTKTGHTFAGWHTNSALTGSFTSTVVTSNFTLYAKWIEVGGNETPGEPDPVTYTVTFDSDGGSNVESKTVNSGSKVSKPSNPTKEGHTFDTWTKEDGSVFDFNTPITSDITLKAKWNIKQVKVVFNANGGSFNDETSITVNINWGETVALPDNPTKDPEGAYTFEFDGYRTERNGDVAFDETLPITENKTVYAAWKEILSDSEQAELISNITILKGRFDEFSEDDLVGLTSDETAILSYIEASGYIVSAFEKAIAAHNAGETISKTTLKNEICSTEYSNAKRIYSSLSEEGTPSPKEEFDKIVFYIADDLATFFMDFFGY